MTKKTIAPDLMYRLLVQGVKDYAIYLLGADGTVLNWNAGAERAKGYKADEIVGLNYECFYSPDDRAKGIPRRNLDLALRNGHLTTEGWRLRKDGTAFWARVALDAIYDEDGTFVGFAKVTRDLTEQRASEQRFQHQARHDALTGLPNRDGLIECLELELPQIAYGSPIAVHHVDLDRFKPINDIYGHQVGDQVLQEVAKRLFAVAGASCVVGRLGGDEFAVLQFGAPGSGSMAAMAKSIVEALSVPIAVGPRLLEIGASVGVACAPGDATDLNELLRCADLALHTAKENGRNGFRFYEAAMGETKLARRLMELKLRHAVAAKDFVLAYQPIVNGQSNRTVGFEALLRWTDQTGQPISPALFVPIAEEMGLMPELGEWVLRTACAQATAWPDDVTVAVNLSPTQLNDPLLFDLVAQVLRETGLPARRLELEITETAILANLGAARETLKRLRGLGISIALDDFGTGFSSLSLVRELPLTRIKIDRSFVSDIDGGSRTTAVIESVVALCRGYGLKTTAEGIETDGQRLGVMMSGCSDLQGYLLGRPQPASQIEWPGTTSVAASIEA
ncbi:EAL domain-containing protein [Aureimonas sp. ME7]|uniref:putative bifunctional diguanylate cyclase/phosphodiesterase n=1 Tax=Aureimonas sp. ME7 TaxID=2744252 RepID=UPI0015F6B2DE|nr:EAL domain-containing protein [Aureimonas sp. ME7]